MFHIRYYEYELKLKPEEYGKLKMSFQTIARFIIVVIAAFVIGSILN
jgi:hypothetical protein